MRAGLYEVYLVQDLKSDMGQLFKRVIFIRFITFLTKELGKGSYMLNKGGQVVDESVECIFGKSV